MTATQDAQAANEIGRDRRRKEDQRLITGRTRWTDNLQLPGMLHMAMVRSPFAHATITSIDTAAAKQATNVVTVFTGRDVADEQGSLPTAWAITTDQKTPPHPPIAVDRVAFAGEVVAVVVARSAAEARDAAEQVEVDYEELPAALELKEAATDSVLAHPDLGTNKSAFWQFDSAGAGTGGSVDEAIETARGDGIVIEREYRQQRLIPSFMEPRSFVCDPTGEQLTLWSSTQIPHITRFFIAAVLGISESKVRVIAPDVGGGFGGKLQTVAEEFITILAARRTGKPCKYTETRSESLMSAHHGRDQWQNLTLAADKDGIVTALKVDLLCDLGAYAGTVGGGVPILGAFMYNAIYKFPAYQFNCTNIYTNKTLTDAYRGAGRPEATYAIERLMDELAVELGVDPLEVRERNWIKHEEFPFTTVAGLEYDSGNYEAATARAREMFGYDDLRAEQQQRRESGDPVQLGIGVSTFTEMCGLAPSRVLGQLNYGAGGWEHAEVRMLPTGKVEVVTGVSAHGQGHETAFSQIVADRLGVPFEDVEVLHGDTQVAAKGYDTYGSRSLVVGGEALVRAADKVVEKAKPIAAHLLEANVDDIEFSKGRLQVRGTDQGMGIGEIATAVFAAHNLPDGVEATLDSEATFDPATFSFPHGTHLCAMEVDTETGAVRMRKYVACDDIGNIINPLIVGGQVHGGLVQGISQALWEEAVYDDSGTLVSGSFVDYLLPTTADTVSFEIDHTTSPATSNSLGTKGVGEAGTIASTPAVVNAIVDAVRQFGVSDIQMPCTPERVWRAIHAGDAGGADPTTGGAAPHFDESTGQEGQTDRMDGAGQMIPAKFDYLAPTSVEEALSALAGSDDAKVIAGGQSLLPVLRMRLNAPELLVDLGKIDTLQDIVDEGDSVLIGSMVPYYRILADPSVQTGVGLLHKAITEVADPQIRHRGTLGGSLVHADPAGDCGAPILALDSELVIAGQGGERTVAAADFFEDLFTTVVGEDELLTHIRVPKHDGWGSHYEKFVRIAHQWPIVAVAATVKTDGGTISEARIGLVNMGSTPLRATATEQALVGREATADGVREACDQAAEGTNPPSDLNGDADYRKHLATVLTRRAVLAAAGG